MRNNSVFIALSHCVQNEGPSIYLINYKIAFTLKASLTYIMAYSYIL